MNTMFNLAETFLIAALIDFYDKQVTRMMVGTVFVMDSGYMLQLIQHGCLVLSHWLLWQELVAFDNMVKIPLLFNKTSIGGLWINQIWLAGPKVWRRNHFCHALQRPSCRHWRYPPHLTQAQESSDWKPRKVQKRFVFRLHIAAAQVCSTRPAAAWDACEDSTKRKKDISLDQLWLVVGIKHNWLFWFN